MASLEEMVDPRIAVLIVWAIFFFVFIILPSLCLRFLACCHTSDGHMANGHMMPSDVDEPQGTDPNGWDRYMFLSAQKRDKIDELRSKVLRRYLRRFSVVLERSHMLCLNEDGEEKSIEDEETAAVVAAAASASAAEVMPSEAVLESARSSPSLTSSACPDDYMDHDGSPIDEETGMSDEKDLTLNATDSTDDDSTTAESPTSPPGDTTPDGTTNDNNEVRIDIIAPPGKLDVVVENPMQGGPAEVADIRARSPLIGELQMGDKLIAVDDQDVSDMPSTTISVLLWSKSKNRERKITILRGGSRRNKEGGGKPCDDFIVQSGNEYTHVRIPYPGYDEDGDRLKAKPVAAATSETTKSKLPFKGFSLRHKVRVVDDNPTGSNNNDASATSSIHGMDNSSKDKDKKAEQQDVDPNSHKRHERRPVPGFCAICLGEYSPSEHISWSSNPDCTHVFHRECIVKWLNTLGRKSSKYQRFSVDPSVSQLLNYRLECPCCRQEFVSKLVLENGEEEEIEEEECPATAVGGGVGNVGDENV